MILRLPYGRDAVTVDLRGLRCRLLEPTAPRGPADLAALVGGVLDAPVGTAPLAGLARGRRRVVLLVPDATRKAFLPEVLPPLLSRLAAAGVSGPALCWVCQWNSSDEMA